MINGEINVLIWLENLRSDFLNVFFELITILGEETTMVVLLSVLYFAYNKKLAKKLFFIYSFSLMANCTIKNIAKIPRPFTTGKLTSIRTETATGYSFPSGHTQGVVTWTFVLAQRFKKSWLYALASAAMLLVAFSRMYLGVHYPSDVTAGAVLGLLAAIFGGYVYDKAKNKNWLYFAGTVVFIPVAICFLIKSDALYADFFKLYGMQWGFFAASLFEEKFVGFSADGKIWKKIIRIVLAILVTVLIRGALKLVFSTEALKLSMLYDLLRYAVVSFSAFGICPWILKKINL